MFREKYKNMSSQIAPSRELIDKVLDSARNEDKQGEWSDYTVGGSFRKSSRRTVRRPVFILVALLVCAFMAMPALAGNVKQVYNLMYLVSPTVAQFFMPIQESCEDNGIKMEVESAYIHEDTAEIYVTLQDLTGDRVDGTTDLYDSYSINRPFNSSSGCQRVGYDEKTGTATFMISITDLEGHNIEGDKITFSVREFLSHKKNYDDIQIPATFSETLPRVETQRVSLVGKGGEFKKYLGEDWDDADVLVQTEPREDFPVPGMDLTGMGYMGGMLHIQTAVRDRLNNDNHGFFYLKDGAGNVAESVYSMSFAVDSDTGDRISYNEQVFDIHETELKNYKLFGTFVTGGLMTKGDWQVTFPLHAAE